MDIIQRFITNKKKNKKDLEGNIIMGEVKMEINSVNYLKLKHMF